MANIVIKIDKQEINNKLEDVWCKNHAKRYLECSEDLADLKTRYARHKKQVYSVATGITLLATALFSYFIRRAPDELDLETFLAMIALNFVLWFVTYNLLKMNSKKREVFESLWLFEKDWKRLKELESQIQTHRGYLEDLGKKVANACRRKDHELETKLMKRFRRDHKVLTNFGICSGGYEEYIPKTLKN